MGGIAWCKWSVFVLSAHNTPDSTSLIPMYSYPPHKSIYQNMCFLPPRLEAFSSMAVIRADDVLCVFFRPQSKRRTTKRHTLEWNVWNVDVLCLFQERPSSPGRSWCFWSSPPDNWRSAGPPNLTSLWSRFSTWSRGGGTMAFTPAKMKPLNGRLLRR